MTQAVCKSKSPVYEWSCTRGSHDDPVHIAGTGNRVEVLGIWMESHELAEKKPGEDYWVGKAEW